MPRSSPAQRSRAGSAPRVLGRWLLACVFSLSLSAAGPPNGVPGEPVPQNPPPGGLRIFAQPGDYQLQNASVRAVVRRSDGALVDFSRRGSVLPTTEQLGTTTDIDGVWDLSPAILNADGRPTLPERALVEALSDGISVRAVLYRGSQVVGAHLRYELDPERPTLRIRASFYAEPELAPSTDLGLSVRWGNVAYFVEGNSRPLSAFNGRVRWAGRSGAGGDLLLRGVKPEIFTARFLSREAGFQGALSALALRPSGPHRSVSAVYELSYEPLPLPPAGIEPVRARLEILVRDERRRPLASKVTLLREGRPEPLFPDDGGLEGAAHFAWTGNGLITCAPPAGNYELIVTAGLERAAMRTRVTLAQNETRRLDAVLQRVLQTPGYLAADLHLHQAPSVDADISLEARVVAVAAEGVELAVATDHFAITDLEPTVRALVNSRVLARPILTLPGTELSTVGNRFGHFNTFPLPIDASIEYRNTTPSRLFAAARAVNPSGVLQVNHPRWDAALGYFTRYRLDARSGSAEPGFDPNFDALEVYNGDDAADLAKVERVLGDFLQLIAGGRRYVATGSSDSHKLAFLDPGLPRTFIASGARDDEGDASASLYEVMQALKAGRALVSSGPFIDASVEGMGPGQTAGKLGPRATLQLRVRATPWVSARRVRVFVGPPLRVLHDFEIPRSEAVTRFEGKLPLPVSGPSFVVVSVAGDEPLINAAHPVLPFAFTNPIWLEP